MRKRYLIKIDDNSTSTIYCPPSMLKNRNLTKISFGAHCVDADFLSHHEENEKITIGRNLIELLHFPDFQVPLHVFITQQTLYIGPLIGIFTSGFTPFPLRPIGERSLFFSKLLSVKKTVGALPFLFGEQHIDWENGLIKGYFFHEDGWDIRSVPFPNVIYDRLPNRKSENNLTQKKVKERLQKEYLIPWYNPGFFNKLDVHEKLMDVNTVAHYLPETLPFTSFTSIEGMLCAYGHVYLKPINGSLGHGVHQIIFDKHESEYYCRYRDADGVNRLRKFQSLESLFKTVFGHKNMDQMIVQQGIHLMKIGQRPVDFRVHTNKDDAGEWKVTAIAAKIAGPGSVTTHLKNGGMIKTPSELFLKDESESITAKLNQAALCLSAAIERELEGIIGEIGFDLGIDRDGEVWLFEANSKPGRSIFTHPELKDFDLLTRKLSIAFAIFLTERSIHHPEEIFR